MTNPQPLDAVRETAAELLKEIAKEREALIKAGKMKKAKPLPEITIDEIPYEIPDNWEWVRLSSCGIFISGYTPKNVDLSNNGSIPYFKVSDMNRQENKKYMYKTDLYLNDDVNTPKTYPKETIIYPKNGGALLTNKKRILLTDSVVDLNTGGYLPSPSLSLDYIYQYFLGIDFKDYQTGSTVPTLNQDRLQKSLIPIPPLSEQKRIVALLDDVLSRIDKARENIEKNIENAEELLQTSLDLIHCPKEELGKIVNICTGKLNANQAVEDGQYPFFTCSRTASKIDRYAYDCEAILLAGNNASGDFNVKHYKGKFEAYQRTYILTAKDEKNIDYRFLYFQVMRSLETLKKEAVGTNTKFLRLPMIQSLKIAYPNISEQREYVKKIDALLLSINKLTQSYKQKLIDLDELRNSVLEKAFRGELT